MGHGAVIAVHQRGEIHELGNSAGFGVQLDNHIHHGVLFRVVDQGQNGAVRPPVDVVVQLILAQVIDADSLTNGGQQRDFSAADAGVESHVGVEETVGVEALQYHLIAQHTGVIKEEGVAVIIAQSGGVEEAVAQCGGAVPVGVCKPAVIAGAGGGHLNGEGGALLYLAPLAYGLQCHLLGLARDETHQQEAVLPAELLVPQALRCCGIVRQFCAGGVDGIADFAFPVRLEGEEEPVAPGSKRI